jgi:hypothetical protein
VDDERRAWSSEQERWRGGVDASLRALESRQKETAASREDQGRDVSRRFSEVYGRMSEIEKDADAQRQRMEDKIDALKKTVVESEATVLDRISKSEAKLMTLWVIGGGGFVAIIALLQWFLGGGR